MTIEPRYMRRALQLAARGRAFASPNPMVGAVIVDNNSRIIGEGYHRRCGELHAEPNAINSVADKSLLRDATMYVTLEPCSHYGKTPPCARRIIDEGIPRVVVGCLDPFEKVAGRGVAMLREAGVEVTVGVLGQECRELNCRFIYAHTRRRPWVTLKWAMSRDGYVSGKGPGRTVFSTPVTMAAMHRERALHDAIAVGAGTVVADAPRLDTRLWSGRSPRRVVLDSAASPLPADAPLLALSDTLLVTTLPRPDVAAGTVAAAPRDIPAVLSALYDRGITSLLVEGGAAVLDSFVRSGLWCEARVEIAPVTLGADGGLRAPAMPLDLSGATRVGESLIARIDNPGVTF